MICACRRWIDLIVLVMGFSMGLAVSPIYGQPASQSPNEAIAIYGDAANFQNNGAFELAVEEWGKFLKQFPDDPLAPKAQHYLGVCNLQLKRYQAAADAFATVIKKYPDFEQLQDAYLNLGWSQYSLGGPDSLDPYAAAAATFQQLITKFPQGKFTDQALFFLGEAKYRQHKPQEAIDAYKRLVDNFPNSSLRADAVYALGVTQEELGQYADAGKTYDLFLSEFPDNELATEVSMRKAETVLQAGDYETAEQMFAKVAGVEGFESVDHAIFRRAFCLAKLEQYAEAGALYAKLCTDYGQSSNAKESAMAAGRCFYRAEQWDDAAKWFDTVLNRGGADAAEAAHWLARIHLHNGQPEKVGPLVAKTLPAAGDSPYLVNLKLDQVDALYEIPESKPKTIEMYLAIAKDHPDHALAAQALYNAAFTSQELKDYAGALQYAAEFVDKYPDDDLLPDVQYVAAECLLLQGKTAEAQARYRQLIAGYPEHPEHEKWLLRHALAMFLDKDYQDIVDALSTKIADMKDTANQAEAHYLVGISQFYLGQSDAATASLAASLKADPKWRQADEAWLYLSRALRKQGRLDQALKAAEKVLSDFPDSQHLDQAHYRCGECGYAQGDLTRATTEYTTVVEQFPESRFVPYSLYGIGWSHLKNEDFEAAIAAFTRLLDEHPNHDLKPDALLARAMCYRQAEKFAEAIEDVASYLATDPTVDNQADALYEKGLAQVALKDHAGAASTFRQILKLKPDYANADKILYELGWALKSLDDKDKTAEAVAVFAQLAEQYPDSPFAGEAHFHVGESYYNQQKYEDAVLAYTAAKEKAAGSDVGEKTVYKLGWANFQLKNYSQAFDDFTEQLQQYPDGTLHPDALFMKAECLFRQEDYERALPAYQATADVKLPSETVKVLALLHGGQSASQLKQWDLAAKMFTNIVDNYATSPYAAEAYYELGWARQNLDQQTEAVAAYEKAAEQSRGPVGARARFMIGEAAFGEKKFDEAIRHFQRVMYGFGGDNASDETKVWQAKAGFEAGRCAEVQIRDAAQAERAGLIEQAKKFYSYVVEKHPQSEVASPAKLRLAELAKL